MSNDEKEKNKHEYRVNDIFNESLTEEAQDAQFEEAMSDPDGVLVFD